MLDDIVDLAVTHAVPVEDDPLGQAAVELVVLAEGEGDGGAHVVVQLLGGVGVEVGHGEVLGESLVEARHHGADTPPLLGAVVDVVGVVADDHGVLHGNVDGPGLPAQLADHLDGDLGGHGHEALGLVQHGAGDALGGGGALQVTLLLDSGVVVALQRKKVTQLSVETSVEEKLESNKALKIIPPRRITLLIVRDDDHDDGGLGIDYLVELLDVGGGPVVGEGEDLGRGHGEAEGGGALLQVGHELLHDGPLIALGGTARNIRK